MHLDYVFFDCWDTLIKYHERGGNFIEPLFASVTDKKGLTLDDVTHLKEKIFSDYFGSARYEISLPVLMRLTFTVAGLNLDLSDREIERLWCLNFDPEPMPGAVDFLKYLKEREIPAACLSNTVLSNFITRRYIRDMLKIEEKDYLRFVLTSADWGAKKPNPYFFEAGKQLAGLSKDSRALYVGDSFSSDVIGSAAAGLFPCYFNHKKKTPRSPEAVRGYYEFDDYSELREFIESGKLGPIEVDLKKVRGASCDW